MKDILRQLLEAEEAGRLDAAALQAEGEGLLRDAQQERSEILRRSRADTERRISELEQKAEEKIERGRNEVAQQAEATLEVLREQAARTEGGWCATSWQFFSANGVHWTWNEPRTLEGFRLRAGRARALNWDVDTGPTPSFMPGSDH